MDVVCLDGRNVRDHAAKVALVHGVLAEEIPPAALIADPIAEAVDIGKTLDLVRQRCMESFGTPAFDVTVWLMTGSLARYLLCGLPVHGCTLFDGKRVTLSLTWAADAEMLGRVFGHEWCHAARLMAAGVSSHAAYVRYLSEPVHWLYEETLAIATEKWLYPHLSWEEAAGIEYSPCLTRWAESGWLSEVDPADLAAPEVLDHWLAQRQAERAQFVYYLAYRLCCTRPVIGHLAQLVRLPASEGLLRLCRGL